MQALNIEAFRQLVAEGGIILDTRPVEILKSGFAKGSISVPGDARFGEFLKMIANIQTNSDNPIFLTIDECSENEALVAKATTAGFSVKGCLQGGFDVWQKANAPVDMIIDVEVDELIMDIPFDENLVIVDVRPSVKHRAEHLKDSISLPMSELTDPIRLAAIEDNDNLYLVGENDADVFWAATILKKHDIHNLRVVLGGWAAIESDPKAEIVKNPELLN